ncbi:MAG TPA: hypothetical protein VIU82_21835 [Bosea sp. (in: a-proteobacteria)]
MNDWNVFARQIALVVIPVILAKLNITESLAAVITGPLADLAASLLVAAGFALVGWIVWLGQRREKVEAKIEAVAELSEVAAVVVKDSAVADALGPKVVS